MASCIHGKSGLARAEWLFLFSIVLIVASLLAPALLSWINFKHTRRAYTDLRVLVSAIRQYHKEYNEWPGIQTGIKKDARFGLKIPNARIMRVLMDIEGPGNAEHAANRNRIDFIKMKAASGVVPKLDVGGNAIDPWGTPYQVVLDANYDATCTFPESTYGEISGEEITVWSAGPDRRSDTDDDIRSWLR